MRFKQTVHSLFKLLVPILETSTCNITTTLSMILIDEASMAMIANQCHRSNLMLRDTTESQVPFGDVLMILTLSTNGAGEGTRTIV